MLSALYRREGLVMTIALKGLFNAYQKRVTGPLGIGFLDLRTDEAQYLNPNLVLPTASTYKIFLLMDLFLKVQKQELELNEEMTLEDYDKSPGTGILYSLTSGLKLTLHDIAVLMMALSDNTAADMLYRRLTRRCIEREILKPLHLKNTKLRGNGKDLISKIYRRPIDLQESSEEYFIHAKITPESLPYIDGSMGNCTTVADMTSAFQEIYAGKMFTETSRQQMVDLLLLCQNNERLPKLLPTSTRVAHKTGSVDRITNDAGIVFTLRGNYILTLLYNGNLASKEEYQKNKGRSLSDPFLAEISKVVYNKFTNQN